MTLTGSKEPDANTVIFGRIYAFDAKDKMLKTNITAFIFEDILFFKFLTFLPKELTFGPNWCVSIKTSGLNRCRIFDYQDFCFRPLVLFLFLKFMFFVLFEIIEKHYTDLQNVVKYS